MSQKIGVLSHSQKFLDRPERFVSKTVAKLLVRRLLAVHVAKHVIQMVAIREMSRALPEQLATAPRLCRDYEHHLEPRLERLTPANSEWLAYLWNLNCGGA